MKIGVIDTDARFDHKFFKNRKIDIRRLSPGIKLISEQNFPFTHAEYVCASILMENPSAEIILYNIIGNDDKKKKGGIIADSVNQLADEGVNIINISLGIEELYSEYFYEVCKSARLRGVILVAAHCNEERAAYPASFDNVIGINMKLKQGLKGFFQYDKLNNNISFPLYSRVSYYQLEQEHLMCGNSFLAARITGMLSVCMEGIESDSVLEYVEELESNKINHMPDFSKYKKTYVICLSNRPDDAMQRRYAKECFECNDIVTFDYMEKYLRSKSRECLENGTLLIDINSYKYYTNYKKQLDEIIMNDGLRFKYVFTRYPIYAVKERLNLQKEYDLLIEQLCL